MLRTHLLQATWNYERQQGLGWAWSLQPVIERLYPRGQARTERLAEHTAYFNTQPTLASVALGAAAALEEQRANGDPVDPDVMARVKGVLGSALAGPVDHFVMPRRYVTSTTAASKAQLSSAFDKPRRVAMASAILPMSSC